MVDGGGAASLAAKAAFAKGLGEAEVKARVIDHDDKAWPVAGDPIEQSVKQCFKVAVMAEDFDEADHGIAGEIVEEVSACLLEGGAADGGDAPIGLALPEVSGDLGGVLVAGVFAGEEEDIGAPAVVLQGSPWVGRGHSGEWWRA